MKFYKLELINREESYNQMFGSTPNVGVMNPLQGKPGMVQQKTAGQMPPIGGGRGAPGVGGLGLGGKSVSAAPKPPAAQRKTNQV